MYANTVHSVGARLEIFQLCLQDGLWHTVIGTMEACLGTAALYTSPDFKQWTSAGAWTNQVRPYVLSTPVIAYN